MASTMAERVRTERAVRPSILVVGADSDEGLARRSGRDRVTVDIFRVTVDILQIFCNI
jgi:hypothetical protein